MDDVRFKKMVEFIVALLASSLDQAQAVSLVRAVENKTKVALFALCVEILTLGGEEMFQFGYKCGFTLEEIGDICADMCEAEGTIKANATNGPVI